MLNRSLKKRMLSFLEIDREAFRRFPDSPSRRIDFYKAYMGLRRKGKFGRENYRLEYGQGRRVR